MNNNYWSGIRSFIEVAKHGSFTAAADATGLSKALLSQQVSSLEKELKVQLLHRTTRSLRLTELGELYLAQCQQGFEQLSQAHEALNTANQELSGPIRVNSVGGLIGEEVVAPLLVDFQQQHPEVEISLDFSSHQVDLLAQRYHLALRMGQLQDSSLVAKHLSTINTHYVASKAFVERHGLPPQPEALSQLPLIYGSVAEWRFQQGADSIVVKAKQGFQIANGRVMLQACLAGLGVARLADIYTQQALDRGQLIPVLPEAWQSTQLSLLSPPGRYPLQRVKLLRDYLAEHFAERYQMIKMGSCN